jgi:hypothetical protein
LSPTAFVAARLLGATAFEGYLVQGAVGCAAAALLIWAWRGPAARPLKYSVLVVANLLVTPYVFNYDLVLLILPIAWLGWHAARSGWLRGEKLILFVAWLSPALVTSIAVLTGFQPGIVLPSLLLWGICRRIAFERASAHFPLSVNKE